MQTALCGNTQRLPRVKITLSKRIPVAYSKTGAPFLKCNCVRILYNVVFLGLAYVPSLLSDSNGNSPHYHIGLPDGRELLLS